MRSAALLFVGVLFGSATQSSLSGPGRIIGVNHVAINVDNFDEAIRFYSEKMGFPEVWRQTPAANGQSNLAYVQVGRDTFIEVVRASANARPGLAHVGLRVDDMAALLDRLKTAGVEVNEARKGTTATFTSGATDPWGLRYELLEIGPESLQAKIIANYR